MMLLAASVFLALAAGLWAVWPVFARSAAPLADVTPVRLLDADARKRTALAALKEAEHDFVAGKLDPRDYGSIRTQLEREAVEALHAAEAAREALPADEPLAMLHACGFTNPPVSRFCAGCGAALHAAA